MKIFTTTFLVLAISGCSTSVDKPMERTSASARCDEQKVQKCFSVDLNGCINVYETAHMQCLETLTKDGQEFDPNNSFTQGRYAGCMMARTAIVAGKNPAETLACLGR